ncbi:MAG: DNA recombination protein RmuC [Deltaproteobacteria bacterium]|nr:DNA recombination protein RmuC [Deltaproteobacteria bacterium]
MKCKPLAQGVGDLKKILSNVKTRGVFGEAQLEALLEEILTPDQYGTNVATIPGSNERVEFAVRLPGRDGTSESAVLLPIDAKFPMDKYQHLVAAYENGDADAVDKARNDLSATVQGMAKDIREKYVEPPHTTDFGIMFLATESLYAEVLRTPGLFEFIRAKHHVVIAGPTTLAAVLNSLQMGFRTLAIEKRSSEVWKLLGAIKTEFGKFGEILDATDRQIQTVSNSIRRAKGKTTTITRKLRDVETLPVGEAGALCPRKSSARRMNSKIRSNPA